MPPGNGKVHAVADWVATSWKCMAKVRSSLMAPNQTEECVLVDREAIVQASQYDGKRVFHAAPPWALRGKSRIELLVSVSSRLLRRIDELLCY